MNLHSAYAKHEQRAILTFSGPVGSGAFGVSPTLYVVENLDGRSTDPEVRAAFVVSGDTDVVELALSEVLCAGGRYRVTVTAVPSGDGSPAATGSAEFLYTTGTPKKNQERTANAADLLLYGSDLLWNGSDFQETATGDLEVIEGPSNVSKALYRRCKSGPLGWDQAYGAKARNYVDAPTGTAGTLRGAIATQCMRDPRITKVEVRAIVDNDTTAFDITPTLLSGAPTERVSIKVRNG